MEHKFIQIEDLKGNTFFLNISNIIYVTKIEKGSYILILPSGNAYNGIKTPLSVNEVMALIQG